MSDTKPEKISSGELLSFGGVQFATGIYIAFSSYYLMMFCTDVAIIPSSAPAILMLFLRLSAVVNGQAIGLLINRMHFKDGKYRPYIKWCALPFALALAALGLTPLIAASGRFLYALVILALCDLFWLALHTASMAMLPYLAKDDKNRTKFVSFSNGSAIFAFILIGSFMLPLAGFLGPGDRAKGFALTLALFAVIAAPLNLIAYFRLKERRSANIPRRGSIKDIYLAIGRNKRILLFLTGFCLYYMADTFKNLSTYYYISYNLQRPDLLPVVILAGLISPLALQPVIPRLLNYAGKEALIVFGLFASSGTSLLMLAAGNRPLPLIACVVLYGMFTAIVANLVYTVIASFSDEIRTRQNMSASEILTAVLDLSSNTGTAIASSAAPAVMAAIGYSANIEHQPSGVLEGIKALYILCTAGGLALAGVVMLMFLKKSKSQRQ